MDTTQTTTYANAVRAIREYAGAKQATLDRRAEEARAETIRRLREGFVEGATPEQLPVCELMAQTVMVGRKDGYPDIRWPESVCRVYYAARDAGIFPEGNAIHIGSLRFYDGLSSLREKPDYWQKDLEAWREAKDYRTRQSWHEL